MKTPISKQIRIAVATNAPVANQYIVLNIDERETAVLLAMVHWWPAVFSMGSSDQNALQVPSWLYRILDEKHVRD